MAFQDDDIEVGDLKKLKDLIHGIDFAMLTTVDEHGFLRSRPMATQEMSDDGVLSFFIDTASPKVTEIQHQDQVNLVYAKPDDQTYVSVSGRAIVNKNKTTMQQLWKPILRAWFPEGLDDPNIGLLQVHIEQAEYWESAGAVSEIIGLAKALTTGRTYKNVGVHGRVNTISN